jgi:hypothetical protein
LKRFGRYLKETLKNGLDLPPSSDFKINCYPDTDFTGLWLQDDKKDLHCVRSRITYVICLANAQYCGKASYKQR